MTNKRLVFLFAIFLMIIGVVVFLLIYQSEEKSSKIYRIGLLQMVSTANANMDGFKLGMADLGYREGENVTYEYFNAEGNLDALNEQAKKFAAEKMDLIFTNTSPATQAAKDATAGTLIPVVFSMVADPVRAGFVASIQTSGNNLTGTSCAYIDIAGKRLEILKEAFPQIKKVLVLYRIGDKSGEPSAEEIKKAGQKLGIQVIVKPVEKSEEIKEILKKLNPGEVDALMDPADSMVTANIDLLVETSLRLKIPLMMLSNREAEKGAIITYGVDYFDLGKQSARLAAKVLEGSAPSEIPIEMPRIFRLIVNMKTANEINLSFPEDFLSKTDRVIR